MSTPHDPQQPPEGYELKKKKKPWYQRLGCIIPIALIVIIIIAIAVNTGGDDSEDTGTTGDTSSDGAPADNGSEEAGPAALGETVSTSKADITASNLRPTSDALGSYLCADVSFLVTGDDPLTLNGLMDWEITNPNGVTVTQTVGGESNYDPVEVGPGGNYSGTVCFDQAADPGEYVLTFEEGLSFSSEQAQWSATL